MCKSFLKLSAVIQLAGANVALIIYDQTGFRIIDTNTAQKGRLLRMESGGKVEVSFLLCDVLLARAVFCQIVVWRARY